MNGHYLVSRGTRDQFFTETELRDHAQSGLLAPGDRVFHPLRGWLYARDVAEVETALRSASLRGKRPPPDSVELVPVNRAAVAGFLLGGLGLLPFVGLVLSGLGLFLSCRGLRASQFSYGSGHKLAIAGVLLSLLSFLPQLAVAVVLLLGGPLPW